MENRLLGRERSQQSRRQNLPALTGSGRTLYPHQSYSPVTLSLQDRNLIRPNTAFARAVVMGNDASSMENPARHRTASRTDATTGTPMSNLSVLMNQQQEQQQQRRNEPAATSVVSAGIRVVAPVDEVPLHDEADSASGPPKRHLGSSAPSIFVPSGAQRQSIQVALGTPPLLARRFSSGPVGLGAVGTPPTGVNGVDMDKVRR